MAPHTVPYLKTLPYPSVLKLIRDAGYTLREVGQIKARAAPPKCEHSVVSRTIRKQMASEPVWVAIAWCVNHPKVEAVA